MNIKIILGLMGFLSAIALCTVLHVTSGVFIPLVIAWFILQILRPVVQVGKKFRSSPWLNITLVFTVLVIAGVLGFRFIASQVIEFSRVYSAYSEKLNDAFNSLMLSMNVSPETLESFDWMGILRDNVRNISEIVVTLSSKFVLTFVFLMFMLLEAPYLDEKIKKAFSWSNASRVRTILDTISTQVSRYLVTLTLISLVTGIFAWLVLTVIGVKLAAGWGVLTVLLNFIPTVGSIIATIPPVVMAIIQFSPSFFKPLLVLISLTAIQVTIGNVITPKVMGDRLGVSPVMILFSLLLWAMIWGIPGALLSTPIISIIKIICENISSLRPIAVLIGSGEAALKIPMPPANNTTKKGKRAKLQDAYEDGHDEKTEETVKEEKLS